MSTVNQLNNRTCCFIHRIKGQSGFIFFLFPFFFQIFYNFGLKFVTFQIKKSRQDKKSLPEKKKRVELETEEERRQNLPTKLDHMKLVWSPETASKAYIDTVESFNVKCDLHQESGVAELVSAMAAGWNAQFIVETWSSGGAIVTSIGLAVASRHTGGRHVCIVSDERSRDEYTEAMNRVGSVPEVVVGDPEEVMDKLEEIDFLVVDSQRKNFSRVLKLANLSSRGGVLICKNANSRIDSSFRWRNVIGNGIRRVVRTAYLPVGKGLDIAHVAVNFGNSGSDSEEGKGKWIKQVDRRSGEEFVIRK